MDDNSRNIKNIRNILMILLIIITFIVLKELSRLLIPLALAGILAILNLPVVNFLKKHRFPKVIITLLVAGFTLVILWLIINMISATINQLIGDMEFLARQFNQKINAAFIWIGKTIPGINIEFFREELNKIITPNKVASVIGSTLGALIGNLGSSFFLFIVYYLILLSGTTKYHEFIDYVAGKDDSGEIKEVWNLTQESISAYMGIKTLISLTTGIITALICWAFGLQFALFWGFLAFLLNYIPSIGSLIAVILPLFMAIIQFNSFGIIIAFWLLLFLTQTIIGSIIDPMVMGSRLKLNTITVIFGLLFWGYIWGIPGMLLSVPLMVMIRLLLERYKDLSIIARIMGNPDKPDRKKPPLFTRVIDQQNTKDS